MINLVIGIAIGAAFSPFWLAVYQKGAAYVKSVMNKPQ